jgi:hypothetical protein
MGNSFFVTPKHCTILANDAAFYSRLFTADMVHMLILRTNHPRVSLRTLRTSANCQVCSLNFRGISCQNWLLSCPRWFSMSYFTSFTLHGALLEVVLHDLGIFLSFLRGTNARSIQASIQKLPLPHKSCSNVND